MSLGYLLGHSTMEVLGVPKRITGPERPNTLTTISLALTYCEQGKLSEAESLLVEVLEQNG